MFRYILRGLGIVLLLLGLYITFFLIRMVYLGAIKPSAERKWVQIPTPGEPLDALKLTETGEVLAEGTNGSLFQFYAYPSPTWKEISVPEITHPNVTCGPITYSGYRTRRLVGEVKSHVSQECGFAEQTNFLEVSLLSNGETWYLEGSNNSYAVIGLFILLPIAMILNVLIYGSGVFFLLIDAAMFLIRGKN